MPDDSGSNQNLKKKPSFFEKLFGSKTQEEKVHEAEEEIITLAKEGSEKGVIGSSARNIIENLFDFDDTSVSEIMTHRTDMVAVEDTDPLSFVVQTAIQSGFSRIPLYHETPDTIIGVIYVKDLLRFVTEEVPENFSLKSVARRVIFVPKQKNCSELFAQMIKEKTQFAVVVDEYGGTEGILTMEDLIEDILGKSIQDEYDNEEEEIHPLGDNRFTVYGSTTVGDVESLVGAELSDSDCDTIAGFFLDKLGRFPKEGETPCVEVSNLRITALKTEERRVLSLLIEKLDTED